MKIFVFRRGLLTVLACAAIALGMVWLVSHPNAVGAAATERQLPIYCVQKEEKVVALTFDAAWGNEDTQQLIDILGKYDVPATFFVVGDWVEKYPESVKALADAGHSIQNHSDTHPYLTQCSADQIIAELESCNDKIEDITGVRPTLIRPPYGDYNDTVVTTIRSVGMEPIQWDVDSLDWKDYGVNDIIDRVCNHKALGNGSIILCHNGAKYTAEALDTLIARLKESGYTFVPLSELIYRDHYHMNTEGRQIQD